MFFPNLKLEKAGTSGQNLPSKLPTTNCTLSAPAAGGTQCLTSYKKIKRICTSLGNSLHPLFLEFRIKLKVRQFAK